MATIPQSATSTHPQKRIQGYPATNRGFDLVMVLLASWFLGGLFLDGWAHNNIGELESFFTPWHFVLYSGFGATALWLAFSHYRNVQKGYHWSTALPKGYGMALVGCALFAVSGFGDMTWHIVFGIEESFEALFSPTHLGLATGMAMIFGGIMFSAWERPHTRGWRELFVVAFGMTLLYAQLTFFTQYATIYNEPLIFAREAMRGVGQELQNVLEITIYAWILIPSLFLSGVLAVGMRRWQLPFGTVALMLGVNALGIQWMNSNLADFPFSVLAAIIAGLIGDVLIYRFKPSPTNIVAYRWVSFAVPTVHWLCLLAVVGIAAGGLWWKIPTWSGVPVLAGLLGVLVSYALVPPQTLDETSPQS